MLTAEDLKNQDIIIYGAGNGYNTFTSFVLDKCDIQPLKILDKKLLNLEDYEPTERDKNATVIITIGKKEYHREILSYLQAKGFKNIIFYFDVYEYHLCYSKVEDKKTIISKILHIQDMLADKQSRNILFGVAFTYYYQNLYYIPQSPQQYIPSDIEIDYYRVIHCGAYNGDTVNAFPGIQALAVFEPEENHFKQLTEILKEKNTKEIISIPCAVYNTEKKIGFVSNGTNSNITDSDNKIQCCSIDHVLPTFAPTYITMDIEGSEIEALKGCEQTIRKHKPALAISVYHRISDLWNVPSYIESLGVGYKMYLRNYTGYPAETILYAVMEN
jgi:FkbM family methyltransferase